MQVQKQNSVLKLQKKILQMRAAGTVVNLFVVLTVNNSVLNSQQTYTCI